MPAIDIAETLKRFAGEFDSHLDGFLRAEAGVPADLAEAVRYAALAPGKRVRPFLVARCCELAGARRACAWAAAAAVECVHAFSLVHDDLPAMDDDDLRRGQPTTHKKFGEALGILAGMRWWCGRSRSWRENTPDRLLDPSRWSWRLRLDGGG